MQKGDQLKVYNPGKLQSLLASQETQAYAMAFLSFFSLAFFTVFAIKPTLTSYFTLQKQIQDAQDTNKDLDSKINMLLAAQKTYQDYQSDIVLLDKALPKDPQFAQLIQKLETIVNEKEATTTAFATTEELPILNKEQVFRTATVEQTTETEPSTDTVIADFPVESVKFSMTILSDYKKNESVITHLLDLKRMFAFSSLEFTRADGNDETGKDAIQTGMDAEAYYFPKEDIQ